MGVAFTLALVAALPEALVALWLKLLATGLLDGNHPLVYGAAAGLAASGVLTWFLGTVSTRLQRRFRDKVTIALESHVARLQASVSTVAHHERPDYLDRLSVLRDQVFLLDHLYMSVCSTLGWILRLAVTIALLASISPVLVLVACPLPRAQRVAAGGRRDAGGAPATQLAGTCSSPPPPRHPARTYGSSASATRSDRAGGPPGSAGTPRSRPPGPGRPGGMPARGRSSAPGTWGRSSSSRRVCTPAP
jgi:hypothetical protein